MKKLFKNNISPNDSSEKSSEQLMFKLSETKEDEKLEDTVKVFNLVLLNLTRKMREAERREQAAMNMLAVEAKRKRKQ